MARIAGIDLPREKMVQYALPVLYGIGKHNVIELLEKAKIDKSIILTFDKDYGEIIFKLNIDRPPAVVFFRFKGENPKIAGKMLIDLLELKVNLSNTFTVIEKESVRQRTYPNFESLP